LLPLISLIGAAYADKFYCHITEASDFLERVLDIINFNAEQK